MNVDLWLNVRQFETNEESDKSAIYVKYLAPGPRTTSATRFGDQ
jgi:hypothetical protein